MKKIILILTLAASALITKAQEYPEMIRVEGGTFTMGDTEMVGGTNERPAHEVKLKTFFIAKTETTILQYKAFCKATGNSLPTNMEKYDVFDKAPMANISWEAAVAYTEWLSGKTGKKYRLPTEAEWEYAARGGNKTKGYRYSGSNSLDAVGLFEDNSEDGFRNVGLNQPNELGIYDMSGNVYEWCQDWYDSGYYAQSPTDNPKGPATGTRRVLRGGSYFSTAVQCRVAYRFSYMPGYSSNFSGFRVVREE